MSWLTLLGMLAAAGSAQAVRLVAGSGSQRVLVINSNVKALLFDCDGTIAETEQTLTLSQFNLMFRDTPGLTHVCWTEAEYGELLKVGASQARLTAYFNANPELWPNDCAGEEGAARRKDFVDALKVKKDLLFDEAWAQGQVQLRPGVARVIASAFSLGLKVAVCSTSNFLPVKRICESLLGSAVANRLHFECGDFPAYKTKKKPDPLMYLTATKTLGVEPSDCVVFEDSNVGLAAAYAAGVPCVVTPSFYTKQEDFARAAIVCETLETAKISLEP